MFKKLNNIEFHFCFLLNIYNVGIESIPFIYLDIWNDNTHIHTHPTLSLEITLKHDNYSLKYLSIYSHLIISYIIFSYIAIPNFFCPLGIFWQISAEWLWSNPSSIAIWGTEEASILYFYPCPLELHLPTPTPRRYVRCLLSWGSGRPLRTTLFPGLKLVCLLSPRVLFLLWFFPPLGC